MPDGERSMSVFTSPLATRDAARDRVGGKGRSLAHLANAGFAVPAGFLVTTAAYRQFVASELAERIAAFARPVAKDGAASFEAAARAIGDLFDEHGLSDAVATEIRDCYERLGSFPATVRSSADLEDSAELSFAGQHATFLNVRGSDAVVDGVKDCWASLWSARAMSYRHENGFPQNDASMAVVVQPMVAAEVSGVLFTANPVTGDAAKWWSMPATVSARRSRAARSSRTTSSSTGTPPP